MTVKPEHLGADRWRIRVYDGQRQRTHSFRANGARAAARAASKHEARLRDDIDTGRIRAGTINGLVDDWQALRDPIDSPSTVRKRAATIRRIRDGLGTVPLETVTALHVDRWLSELRTEGLSETTVANHRSALRAILNQGEAWDRCTVRPVKKSKAPRRAANRRPSPPTAAAVRVLLEAAPPTLRIAAMLAAYAGLRRGEVVGLRWTDVNWDAGTIHVQRAAVELKGGANGLKPPKSGHDRTVYVSAALLAALAEHRDSIGIVDVSAFGDDKRTYRRGAPNDGFVVGSLLTGEVRKVGWVSQAWRRHTKKHGATGVRFHDLRHFYVTTALDAGHAPAVVGEQVGHLQLTTTLNIYGHAEREGARRLAATMDERWMLNP